ncbi:MAG TPA: hypothetical protein VGE38_01960 [Nocardioides sp.]|uniref:hypothetical protein n=1 Tax=Nocardioides sp. TaxID=35761 RepID=UPI002ED8D4B7
MARFSKHLRHVARLAAATLVASTVPAVAIGSAAAADGDEPAVAFFTPIDGQSVRPGDVHVMLGAATTVQSVKLTATGGAPGTSCLARSADVFETTITASASGTLALEAAAFSDADCLVPLNLADPPVQANVTISPSATRFAEPDKDLKDDRTGETLCGPFIRPRVKIAKGTGDCAAVPLGYFTSRLDGHTYTRTTGGTTGSLDHRADAPTLASSTAPTTGGTAPSGGIFRATLTLTPEQVAARRAVIRVTDGTSSEAVEAPLYAQVVTHVRSTTVPVAGGVVITSKLSDQYGQPVVGAPARLTGYANGSRTPVDQLLATDVNGDVTFAPVPANGFYITVADVDLNGSKAASEPSFESVVGRVAYAAPGRALYHNNARTKGGSGTIGDSLRGTRAAAARGYKWIDQNGQLSFTTAAVMRSGARGVSQPGHLTWVNAHGAPYNPRWLKKGRFPTRAWSGMRRRVGLRNADMTFQQNAARGISVEWEVKNIRPFTSPRALNLAFSSLAASARRYYGPAWQRRVEIKVLSNLSGGPTYALRILKAAHAHGFTTMYLARGAATRVQIPAEAHAYVDRVRGAAGSLYAYTPPAWQNDIPKPKDAPLTAS